MQARNRLREFRRTALSCAVGGLLAAALLSSASCQRSDSPSLESSRTPTVESVPDFAAPDGVSAVAEEVSGVPEGLSPAVPSAGAAADSAGRALYLQHCAACHGQDGNGQGLAAPYLFPKPRDFGAGKFRLVRTTNGLPTAEDLDAVLVRGMPGSSMPPWPQFSPQERTALVAEVIRLHRQGVHDEIVRIFREEEELEEDEIDPEEVQELVERRTTPGPVQAVPEIGPAEAEAVARGKAIYIQQSCHSCHGLEGRGDGQQKMVDDEGFPMRPRDLTRGIFKGGHDPESLYWRLALGMPGTPMPSSGQLPPEQLVDLVHFIRSMSDEETRQSAVLNRERLLVRAVGQWSDASDGLLWESVEPVRLQSMPLWWRDDADPDLEVQALHDGQQIAVRLRWRDETPDLHAGYSESFPDAVAIQLYQGDAEPFLGMGDPQSRVDVWFWDAARQQEPATVDQYYPRTVVDVYPFSEHVVDTAQYERPGTRLDAQPEGSLPALAVGNPIVPAGSEGGGSALVAAGPRTLTFRLPQNQHMQARGQWDAGRWTVVMTRPLAVAEPGEGVSLQAGVPTSIAFAVWDGSRGDRNGQKAITIWQDLVLETVP